MAKYLVLYNSTVSPSEMMAQATPEQMKAGMEVWMAWAQKCGSALVDLGSPVGKGRNVTPGSSSDVDGPIGGYSVLEAGSLDEAAALLDGHPHFMTPGEPSISLLEYIPIPGM